MKKKEKVNRTISLFKEQNNVVENWKWEYRLDCSKVIGFIIDHFDKKPDELKKIIDDGLKNEKK